jgi:hypothetical protein
MPQIMVVEKTTDIICNGGPTTLQKFMTWDPCDIVYVHSVITESQNSYGFLSQNTFFHKVINKNILN